MSTGYIQGSGGTGYVQRSSSSGLADVLDVLLDKGLVIDVFLRVSLVGIELLAVDARVVIASIDTYLRFAEAVNRLDLGNAEGAGLPELITETPERVARPRAGAWWRAPSRRCSANDAGRDSACPGARRSGGLVPDGGRTAWWRCAAQFWVHDRIRRSTQPKWRPSKRQAASGLGGCVSSEHALTACRCERWPG